MSLIMKLRLIGDIHGNPKSINNIKQTLHNYDLTIQLGDFGVGFGAEQYLNNIDSNKLKILQGNHDSPGLLSQLPHALNRFGILELNDKKLFYIGGARSIDTESRIPLLNWWPDEQLSYKECNDCLELYEKECKDIDIILSHDIGINIGMQVLGFWPQENLTNKLLYELWKIKEPEFHYFGHYHRSFNKKISNTNYRCLDINEMIILDI